MQSNRSEVNSMGNVNLRKEGPWDSNAHIPLLPDQIEFCKDVAPSCLNPNKHAFTIRIHLPFDVAPNTFQSCIASLVAVHPALGFAYERVHGASWRQYVCNASPVTFLIDAESVPGNERDAFVDEVAVGLVGLIDTRGPVSAFSLVRLGRKLGNVVMIAVHHLVADHASAGILRRDLLALLGRGGARLDLRYSYVSSARSVYNYAYSPKVLGALAYWNSIAWDELAQLPEPAEFGPFLVPPRKALMSLPIPASLLGRLIREPNSYEGVLALLAASLTNVFEAAMPVAVVHNGRAFNDSDRSRTPTFLVPPKTAANMVGWLTVTGLRILPKYMGQDWNSYVASVAATEAHPTTWGLLRHISAPDEVERLAATRGAGAKVWFNYTRSSTLAPPPPRGIAQVQRVDPFFRGIPIAIQARQHSDGLSLTLILDQDDEPYNSLGQAILSSWHAIIARLSAQLT